LLLFEREIITARGDQPSHPIFVVNHLRFLGLLSNNESASEHLLHACEQFSGA
jgi:hypothetical protein